ncbi:MAG TPA: BrnT family toxin, partial [Terriglobales bacterium]
YVCYAYSSSVSPTFDPEKNAANIAKHGVSLAEGDGVLHDPWRSRSRTIHRNLRCDGSRSE